MSTFHLQIVTPDGGFFDGEAEKLIVRAIDGDVCIPAFALCNGAGHG